MKKALKIIISLALIAALISTFIISTYASEDVEAEIIDENSSGYIEPAVTETAFGNYQNENLVGAQKNLELDGQTLTLTYSYTFNNNSIAVEDRDSAYSTRDVFVDENETEYYYLYNTDKFLGFINPLSNRDNIRGNISVDEETAVNVANEYLPQIVENFDKYIYEETVCRTDANVYDVRFFYYLNGIKTDEVARALITPDGGIVGAYCFDMGKYAQYEGKELTLQTGTANASAYANSDTSIEAYMQTPEAQTVESYITTDDSGQLLLYTYSFGDEAEDYKEEMLPITAQ